MSDNLRHHRWKSQDEEILKEGGKKSMMRRVLEKRRGKEDETKD